MPLKTSKLCKSFAEIMRDTSPLSMLGYLIQYMESVSALHMVQFWLTVESFKATAQPMQRTKTLPLGESATYMQLKAEEEEECANLDEGSLEGCIRNSSVGNTAAATTTNTTTITRTTTTTTSSGERIHKVLQRRDTENHKYCNCRIGMHDHEGATPPLSLKRQGGTNMADGDCSDTTLHSNCEHGSPRVKRLNQSPDLAALKYQTLPNRVNTEYLSATANLTLENDALGIYSNYLALNATRHVGVVDEIRQRVEVCICPEDGKIDNSCFNEAQEFVYKAIEKRYYPGFLQSSFLCKYQLDYIASGALNLVDFLLGENALFYFMEFMEQEGASSLLQFWLTAENFYNELSSPAHIPDMEADTSDAISIYNRYFSLQAKEPLNMENSVRMDVENRICDEHGPRPDSYLRPQLVAFHTMNEVYFPTFMDSSIYLRFLNELVHMLNKEDELTQAGEGSTKTGKTSSAAALKLSHFIMGKDLDDPNSLWERPAFQFRLGFVNEFGEYISEIDPIPFKSAKKDYTWSVSARVLRKRRNEEELAMKIAKNVIREVTNRSS